MENNPQKKVHYMFSNDSKQSSKDFRQEDQAYAMKSYETANSNI